MIDCTDRAYAGAVVIYMMYAAQYGIFQNMVIYVLGTLTNEPRKTAAMGGLFVGGWYQHPDRFTVVTDLSKF